MTRVVVPNGAVIEAVPPHKWRDPLTTNRTTRYRFDLLDVAGQKFGELDGVSSGSIEWNANAQVKAGGKIAVAKDNEVHKRDIRVAVNRPLIEEKDFEVDTDTFAGNPEFGSFSVPLSTTRNTDTFYEGGAALDIEWDGATTPVAQNVVGEFTGLTVGKTYTFVARVLNTEAAEAYAKISFVANKPLAIKPDWQTVAMTFEAIQTSAFFGVMNADPVLGHHTLLDNVALYQGETDNYNGEHFEYAPFSWMHARVRPVIIIEGVAERALGVFVPAAPTEQWDEAGGRQEIELLDRTSILAQDYVEKTYTVKKNANVISEVRKLIASTGERPGAITKSSETVKSNMTWGAGTNKLTIVNDLLDAAGYFALWADGTGQFRVQKYRKPKSRPVTYDLLDNDESIYIPTLSIDNDVYAIPNRVVMTAQGDGESEGWVAVATNENEKSPYSYQRRGRWITDVQSGVEATSEENLQNKADNRLHALTSVQSTIEIQHAPVPRLSVNDVVRFRRKPAGVNTLFTVSKTAIDFDPTSLAKTTLSEVIDLSPIPGDSGGL